MMKQLGFLTCSIVLPAACSSRIPQNLVDARAAYQHAASGPAARRSPAQLHAAATSLLIAEKNYDDEGDSQRTRDRAYVAMRKAQLAEVQAAIAADDERSAVAKRRLEQEASNRNLITRQDLDKTRAQLASEPQRRQEAERAAAEAMSALTSVASVKQEPRGTVITLSGSVIFASGKADLLPAALTKLNQVASALKQSDSGAKFEVVGHTDSRGSPELNQNLSTRRAAAVRSYLISQGVPEDRITSEGLGPSNPIADNKTAEGRANNRRVEIIVKGGQSQDQSNQPEAKQNSQPPSSPQRSPNGEARSQQQSASERLNR